MKILAKDQDFGGGVREAKRGLVSMRAVMRVCAALLVALVAGRISAATPHADEPSTAQSDSSSQTTSLRDTLAFLKKTIEADANGGGGSQCPGHSELPCTWRYKPKNFSSCKVSWVFSESTMQDQQVVHDDATVTVPLSETFGQAKFRGVMNGQGDTAAWQVTFSLRDDPIGIREEQTNNTIGGHVQGTHIFGRGQLWADILESEAHIEFGRPGVDDQQIAGRVADAFAHAAELCQQQLPKFQEVADPGASLLTAFSVPAAALAKRDVSGASSMIGSLQTSLDSARDLVKAKAHGGTSDFCHDSATDCSWS
jgi:hypothetical protein